MPARILGAEFLPLEVQMRGGMEVSEAKRLRDFEPENARLKTLLAEAELDTAMLKDVVSKKW